MAANTTRAANPMVNPINTCCTITITACGELIAMSGMGGKLGCAQITIKMARDRRTRRGTERCDSTGAVVKIPATRKNAHNQGVIQASTCASVKLTTQPTTVGIDSSTLRM